MNQSNGKIPKSRAVKLAEDLLANPLLGEIAEQIDKEYYERWAESVDAESMERIHRRAQGLREVLAMITSIAQTTFDTGSTEFDSSVAAGDPAPPSPEVNH